MGDFDALIESFEMNFNRGAEALFSAPGRVELGGNHTDHQRGRVLCAAIDLDTKAAAAPRQDSIVRIVSEGFDPITVQLDAPFDKESNRYSSQSIVMGVAEAFKKAGYPVRGFDACVCSNVSVGSGLSSSASFEVLVGAIFDLFCAENAVSPTELAIFGQYAENEWFGKPSGLMDQLASALGGVNAIDFEDDKNPKVEHLTCDFEKAGYAVYVIDSGEDHAELTGHYAAITEEMKQIAAYYGKEVLRDVSFSSFLSDIPALRAAYGDRAVLRALHFFGENERVVRQTAALREGRGEDFLKEVTASGLSSYTKLQNVIPSGWENHQSLGLAVSVIGEILGGRGAVRVHGGGFAGTALAFVPLDTEEEFREKISAVFGVNAIRRMSVRNEGVTARFI